MSIDLEKYQILLTMGELLELAPAIDELSNTRGLPSDVAYRIGKLNRKIQQEVADFKKAHDKVVYELGEPMEDGINVKVTPDNMDAYNKEVEALRNEEIVIGSVVPIKFEEIANAGLHGSALAALDPIMVGQPTEH